MASSVIWRLRSQSSNFILFSLFSFSSWLLVATGGNSFNFDIYNHDNIWNVITGSTIGWASCYCTSQTQVQRYCSMKDKTQARR